MLTVKELKLNVFELTLEGVLEKTDIETMERELTPVLKGDAPLGLIVRAENWRDLTADAMAEDMKFEFGHFAQWAKIAKMAVVTDLQAFSALLKSVESILPMIEMRSFGSAEAAAAEAFASDLPAQAARTSGSGMTLLSDGSDGVIAYEIDGLITADDAGRVMEPLKPILAGDGEINLLAKVTNYAGFDPALLTDRSFMGADLQAIGHVNRYAIVGGPSWMKSLITGVAPMMPFEMRFFDASEEETAQAWVQKADTTTR